MGEDYTAMLSTTTAAYCPTHWEHICWPQTAANHRANISCASLHHQSVDARRFVSRQCLPSGLWENITFKECIHPTVLAFMSKNSNGRTKGGDEAFQKIAKALQYIELVGLSISLISVLLSLIIFVSFKSLYCTRTKIHMNLLLAILIEIVARLTTYGIQMVPVKPLTVLECSITSHRPPVPLSDWMCRFVIVCLQFGKTSMFLWMLCEGIHLNSVLTVSVFKKHWKMYHFYLLGWAVPFALTFSWSVVMLMKEPYNRCFYHYMHLNYYWIIEGPRYTVMMINVIFLLNIIRVLMVKIREGSEYKIREEKSRTSVNAQYVRKAVKAAVFLLPLLGILHLLETFVSARGASIVVFTMYSTVTIICRTLQGFFCSLLYCFLNAEVRKVVTCRFLSARQLYDGKRDPGTKNQFDDAAANRDQRSGPEFPSSNSHPKKKISMPLEECRLTSDADEIPRTIVALSP